MVDGDTRDGNTDNREEILPSTATLVPSPGPILCWIISWNFPDSKNPAEVLDNRIKEEMEEEIVCKLWTQEPENFDEEVKSLGTAWC